MTTGSNNQPIFPGLPVATLNTRLPTEGPRTIPVLVNFDNGATQTIDISQLVAQKKISMVQSLYVDNSDNSASVSIAISGSGQTLVVPPESEAYFPVLAPVPCVFTLESDSTSQIFVGLNNFPTPAFVWNVQSQAFQFTGGKLQVTDPVLDGLAVQNGLQVVPNEYITGGGAVPAFAGDTFYTGSTSADSAQTIISAPGNALAFYLRAMKVDISNDAATTSGAEITVTVKDGSTTIAENTVYVPSSGGTSLGKQSIFDFDALNYPSAALNNALTITLSAALSAGKVSWTVIGGTSTFAG